MSNGRPSLRLRVPRGVPGHVPHVGVAERAAGAPAAPRQALPRAPARPARHAQPAHLRRGRPHVRTHDIIIQLRLKRTLVTFSNKYLKRYARSFACNLSLYPALCSKTMNNKKNGESYHSSNVAMYNVDGGAAIAVLCSL